MNPQILFTCCDGRFFPSATRFNRILADVPCSGDGTTRKNINLWKSWSQLGALSLHAMQYQIAWQGASCLLEVGGYMCYSTCSVNPIEDEAVVADLLRNANGALELVDIKLDGFKVRPGMSSWHVMCEIQTKLEAKNRAKKMSAKMQAKRKEWEEKLKAENSDKPKEAESNDDNNDTTAEAKSDAATESKEMDNITDSTQQKTNRNERFQPDSWSEESLLEKLKAKDMMHFTSFSEVPENLQKRVRPSVFPPSKEEAKKFQLDRCMRVLPHDNNTGGFFVALLRKVSPISRSDRREADAEATDEPEIKRQKLDDEEKAPEVDGGEEPSQEACKKKKAEDPRMDDFGPVPDEILDPIVELFGLGGPKFRKDLFMTKAVGKAKIISYVAPTIKDLIDEGIQNRIKVINSGLKAFERSSLDNCSIYRVSQDAAQFLMPLMTKRKILVSFDDFMLCLDNNERFVDIESFSVREEIRALDVGSFVLVLDGYDDHFEQTMVFTLWRCRQERVDKLVSKVDIAAMKTKLTTVKRKGKLSNHSSTTKALLIGSTL